MGRDAMKVVLYEDNAKRRVGAMIAGLRGLQTLNTAVKGLAPFLPSMESSLLQGLLTLGQGFPELDGPLGDLEGGCCKRQSYPTQVFRKVCLIVALDSLSHWTVAI